MNLTNTNHGNICWGQNDFSHNERGALALLSPLSCIKGLENTSFRRCVREQLLNLMKNNKTIKKNI